MEVLASAIILVALGGIALGRLPRLRMDRPGIALAGAAAILASGFISPEEAFAAVDIGTLALLLAMMIIVANLRLSGFFTLAGGRILGAARSSRQLLALIVLASGILSALFLNDTVCIIFTPLVAEICLRARRNPLPYLIGVATAANVGSAATIIGNPQNMLIGAQSGIPFGSFLLRLGPPSLLGLAAVWLLIVALDPREFARGQRLAPPQEVRTEVDGPLLWKSSAASASMLVLLLAGVPAPVASLAAASLLLVTRRVEPERVFAHVDFGLLVFFAGLFILTRAIQDTLLFKLALSSGLPALSGPGGEPSMALLAGSLTLASNLVSNVPAVMLFRPLVAGFAEPDKVWLLLALASTYAGNLTLLGSVANLIVAEGARKAGIALGFGAYLRVGLPVTVATLLIGTAWLALG
jgi:Na+/H+ antiporter NhaD/arsenite permease-like protein